MFIRLVGVFVPLFLVLSCLNATTVAAQGLFINEIAASNGGSHADEYGEHDDWVEIYNAGDTAVDIGGYFLTDRLNQPTKCRIPTGRPEMTTIEAGGYLVVWFDGEPEQGPLHVCTSLSRDGEQVGLFATNGATVIDSVTFGPQRTDFTFGRATDGAQEWHFFSDPTPGAPNHGGRPGFTAAPSVTPASGFYSGGVNVQFETDSDHAEIRYATGGDSPTDDAANQYAMPISLDATTVVRVIAEEPGFYPSEVVTTTYFIDEDISVPVVSVTTDSENLWDPMQGIYANPFMGLEHPAFVEFFKNDGHLAFAQPIGIRIFGGHSRTYDKKSFTLRARARYGASEIPYPLFDDRSAEHYDGFILRGYPHQHMRNPFIYEMYRQADAHVDIQAYRHTVLFLNGEYWGMYVAMERKDDGYVLRNHGTDDIDMLDFEEIVEGDATAYNRLLSLINSSDLADTEAFEVIRRKIDVDNLIDYWIAEIHTSKLDNEKNSRYWRPRTEEGRWRWLSFDMDYMEGVDDNTLARIAGVVPARGTMLLGSLLRNEDFRNQFVNRYADYMNSVLLPEETSATIDRLASIIGPEIGREYDRWDLQTSPPFDGWVDGYFRPFYAERSDIVRGHIVDQFNLPGKATITVKLASEGGTVRVNTLSNREDNWSGVYFEGIPVPIEAEAAPGYQFAGWSGDATGTDPRISISLDDGDVEVVARFERRTASEYDIIINEIAYNPPDEADPGDWIELHNRGEVAIDISGWIYQDERDDHVFVIPHGTVLQAGGFLVIAQDLQAFSLLHPDVHNVVGSAGFGLSGSGELVRISNADGELINALTYDDEAPWPTEPDGNGPTLELKDPTLDNTLGENWVASREHGGTPGAVNSALKTGIGPDDRLPADVSLISFPNPFSSTTTIAYDLPAPMDVRLRVFDVMGREVAAIDEGMRTAGRHEVPFDGNGHASGIYFVRLDAQGVSATRSMMIVR